MKLTESKLKTLVTEEILLTLIENKESAKAKAFYLQNRELLDEGWLDKFVPMSLRSNWAQIEKDAEAEEKVEQAVKDLRKHKEFGKPRISDEDLKKVLTRWTQEKRTNLTSDEEEVIIKTLMQAKEKETQGAPSSKPEEEGDAGATGEEEGDAALPSKPESPASTVKDVKDILADSAQRRLLLRGIISLLTNNSVEKALTLIRPEGARDAVLRFLKQIADMDPKALKKIKSQMQGDLFNQFMASDDDTGPDWHLDPEERSGRKADAKVTKQLGQLGLEELQKRDWVKKIVVLEALNLYIERKLLK